MYFKCFPDVRHACVILTQLSQTPTNRVMEGIQKLQLHSVEELGVPKDRKDPLNPNYDVGEVFRQFQAGLFHFFILVKVAYL